MVSEKYWKFNYEEQASKNGVRRENQQKMTQKFLHGVESTHLTSATT